jgi:hypothetical protein
MLRLTVATLCFGLSIAPASLWAATPTATAAKTGAAEADSSQVIEKVDPKSLEALRRMSAFLQSLPAFALTSDASIDLVLRDGQKVQIDGVARYKIRRPAGFVIDVDTSMKDRRFFYDGKVFTVLAPKLGYYATVPAPATNRQVLDVLWTKYGIALPLEDLFRWSDPAGSRDTPQSGFLVGSSTVDGVATDHYAFREKTFDWQVWIQQGDQPIPRKVVIVDRTDPAAPTYTARLTWDLSPALSADDFTYRPGNEAKAIRLSAAAAE